jgi:signal transduction histidine kinase/CheY-like chemotaxis protein
MSWHKRVFSIAQAWPQHLNFSVAFSLVLATGVAAIIMFFRVEESANWVAHTLEVRAGANELLTQLLAAETSQRGYLLTQEVRFLEPYETAVRQIEPALAKLGSLTLDNPAEQLALEKLAPLVASRLALLRDHVSLIQSDQGLRAASDIKQGTGKRLMDDIGAIIARISQDEHNLLKRRERTENSARIILLTLLLGSLTGASILAVAAVETQRRLIKELQEEASKRASVEATLRQSQKMEAVGQLTGGVAHDFNNLLTIILGNLDTMRRRLANISADVCAPLARPLDAALQGTKSAAKLTHRLLAFSRQQALEPVPLDLNKLIGGISVLLERTVGAQAAVETVLAGGLWLTFADANQMENALINLAVNAKDAMPKGGKITIETANGYLDEAYAGHFTEVQPGQYVVLSVTDTGTGIDPDILERVFEPFFTTKQPGTGTGLGLAMIHGFVKQSGGHIRIYSEVGEGTTVKVYMPRLTQEPAIAAVPKAIDLDLQPLAGAKASETILVVEDNEGVLEFASSILEDLGYRVLPAKDGSEAMQILESEPAIDLLFTDVVMPNGMSGRQLADLALSKRPGLPVLFTTGYSRNAIVHQGRLDSGVHLVSKPYTQRELAQKIRAILDGATADQTS